MPSHHQRHAAPARFDRLRLLRAATRGGSRCQQLGGGFHIRTALWVGVPWGGTFGRCDRCLLRAVLGPDRSKRSNLDRCLLRAVLGPDRSKRSNLDRCLLRAVLGPDRSKRSNLDRCLLRAVLGPDRSKRSNLDRCLLRAVLGPDRSKRSNLDRCLLRAILGPDRSKRSNLDRCLLRAVLGPDRSKRSNLAFQSVWKCVAYQNSHSMKGQRYAVLNVQGLACARCLMEPACWPIVDGRVDRQRHY